MSVGAARRTVAKWSSRGRDIQLRIQMQAALDTVLARASDEVRERFEQLRLAGTYGAPSTSPNALVAPGTIEELTGNPVRASYQTPATGRRTLPHPPGTGPDIQALFPLGRGVSDRPTGPPTADTTGADGHATLRHIADQVADCFAESGYAFVEEDKVDRLAATLESFLTAAGIPVNPPDAGDGTIWR